VLLSAMSRVEIFFFPPGTVDVIRVSERGFVLAHRVKIGEGLAFQIFGLLCADQSTAHQQLDWFSHVGGGWLSENSSRF